MAAAGEKLDATGPTRRPARSSASPWWETSALSVLVAEEDPAERAGFQRLLNGRAEVTLCADGAEALWEAGRTGPSVIVLSATLPVVPAADVATVLARHRNGPVSIAVGVGFGQTDRAGSVLAAGANRVMSRPYQAREVEPLLREHLAAAREHRVGVLRVGELELDGPAFTVSAAGEELRLNLREFELLRLLMLHVGGVVPQEHIREQLWEARGESVTANTIAVHMRRLRSHVQGVADIVAVRGVGYRLRAVDAVSAPTPTAAPDRGVGPD
jgi:DNA-binding response OmpR family regulator